MRFGKLICLSSIIVLVALLVSSAFLLDFARKQYAAALSARVWPLGQSLSRAYQSLTPDTNIPSLLLLGDSRIAEWGVPDIPGWHVFNGGVRQITSAQLALRCRSILEQTRPQLVVIQVGINDLKLLGVHPELDDLVVSNCVANILATAGECRSHNARVIVTLVWPIGKVSLVRRLVWSDAVAPAIEETNARLQSRLSGRDGEEALDLFGRLTHGYSEKQRFGLYHNTLHLKPEIYARLSEFLKEAVAGHSVAGKSTYSPHPTEGEAR